MRALIVDDEAPARSKLRRMLAAFPDMEVIGEATGGSEAMALLADLRPDVIFLDLEMPVMGGLEAARQIRALQAQLGQRPSVIAAFSAHDDEATRRQCLEEGFDLYLAKPSSREEVFAVLCGQDPALAALLPPADDGRVWVEPGLMPLMPEFLSSRRQIAEELATAVAQGQRDAIRTAAHKLAGSLAMYGFKAASSASRDLEQAAATEDFGALQARCTRITNMLAQARPVAREAAG